MRIGSLIGPSRPSTALIGENRRQRRIEFGLLVEIELSDDVARQIARKNELNLAGHRLVVDQVAVADILVGIRTQKNIVAALDEDARLR